MSEAAPVKAALLIVSHSAKLAQGVVELAAQMAPGVCLKAVGGRPDGGLGTDYDAIETQLGELLENGHEVAILTDLGSATMSVESVLEFVDGPARLLPGPIAEGAVAAAVAAAQGGGLDDLDAAVRRARHFSAGAEIPIPIEDAPAPAEGAALGRQGAESGTGDGAEEAETVTQNVVVGEADGLHARPAALVARMVAQYQAAVTINGAPANSVLELLSLNVRCGDQVSVSACGPQAADVVDAVATALKEGIQ